jgi:hypothetical protein
VFPEGGGPAAALGRSRRDREGRQFASHFLAVRAGPHVTRFMLAYNPANLSRVPDSPV